MGQSLKSGADVLTNKLINALRGNADRLRAPMIEFAQRLVAVPSLPGQEGGVATLVADEMRRLGYSRVRSTNWERHRPDKREQRERGHSARSVMFNTHMGQVMWRCSGGRFRHSTGTSSMGDLGSGHKRFEGGPSGTGLFRRAYAGVRCGAGERHLRDRGSAGGDRRARRVDVSRRTADRLRCSWRTIGQQACAGTQGPL